MEENSFWREVIRLKYKVEGGWFTKAPKESYGVGLWKDICKENKQLKTNCNFNLATVEE